MKILYVYGQTMNSTLSSLIVFIDVVDTYIVHITLGIYYYTYVRVRNQ